MTGGRGAVGHGYLRAVKPPTPPHIPPTPALFQVPVLALAWGLRESVSPKLVDPPCPSELRRMGGEVGGEEVLVGWRVLGVVGVSWRVVGRGGWCVVAVITTSGIAVRAEHVGE